MPAYTRDIMLCLLKHILHTHPAICNGDIAPLGPRITEVTGEVRYRKNERPLSAYIYIHIPFIVVNTTISHYTSSRSAIIPHDIMNVRLSRDC